MSKKLNAVIAVFKATKTRVYNLLSEHHKTLQKGGLFLGLTKKYTSRDAENGDKLPPENHRVTMRTKELLADTRRQWVEYLDTALTVDKGNQQAQADIVVDGVVIAAKVPVTTLLFLEKQLSDMITFVSKLPTLSPDEEWSFSSVQGLYQTPPVSQHRTKKVTKFLTVVEATPDHPAQVKEVTEDIIEGYWETVKFSSALPAPVVAEWTERAVRLLKAVKSAREEANSIEVASATVGDALFGYIFKE